MANASLLHLNLRRTYFDQIAQGGKKTEYRDRSAYWAKRLEGRAYDLIVFRNGMDQMCRRCGFNFGAFARRGAVIPDTMPSGSERS
jgi:hypothetical protein